MGAAVAAGALVGAGWLVAVGSAGSSTAIGALVGAGATVGRSAIDVGLAAAVVGTLVVAAPACCAISPLCLDRLATNRPAPTATAQKMAQIAIKVLRCNIIPPGQTMTCCLFTIY